MSSRKVSQRLFARWFAWLGLAALPIRAQSFAIESFTIGGGGGTSSGGAYMVSGTIGQPDSGESSGGEFSVQGGFWAAVSEIVVVESPEMTIHLLSNGAVQICWPSSASDFALQESSTVDAPLSWSPSTRVPTDDGVSKCVTILSTEGSRFFRLAK